MLCHGAKYFILFLDKFNPGNGVFLFLPLFDFRVILVNIGKTGFIANVTSACDSEDQDELPQRATFIRVCTLC